MKQYNNRGSLACMFSDFLKGQLRLRNITQKQFARDIHVEESTLRKWLHNGISKTDNMELVLTALGVSLGDVFR